MKLLFLDFETTGLNPKVDRILECGVVLYDLAQKLELHRQSWLVDDDMGPIRAQHCPMDKYVHEMHTKSGLFKAHDDSDDYFTHPYEVEEEIFDAFNLHNIGPGQAVLAGYSVHTDRRYIEEKMPALHRYLSHRHIDVSVLRELDKVWNPPPADAPKTEPAHRSLADCEQALAELLSFEARFKPRSERDRAIAIYDELHGWRANSTEAPETRSAHEHDRERFIYRLDARAKLDDEVK